MERVPYEIVQEWEEQVRSAEDPFVYGIPKIELHVHIEGTVTPELRWKLAQRNGLPLRSESKGMDYCSLDQLKESYNLLQPQSIKGKKKISAFFEAYYGGMEVLRTEEDFYDLAMNYFVRASTMNIRYCEPSFDLQAHTRRGVHIDTIMRGFRRANTEAKKNLNVESKWIMCFLRDQPLEAAIEHYPMALPYRDMIVGIGLDGNEYDRPPILFEHLYLCARADGFKITSHCDVTQKDTHEHIRQVVDSIGGTGADRCDHGLDAADSPNLIAAIAQKGIAMTICPWAYVRHMSEEHLFRSIRTILDAGIKLTINSDSPAYMEDNWVIHNLLLVRQKCGFSNEELAKVERNAVDVCWADSETKNKILKEIDDFCASFPTA